MEKEKARKQLTHQEMKLPFQEEFVNGISIQVLCQSLKRLVLVCQAHVHHRSLGYSVNGKSNSHVHLLELY